MRRFVFGIAAVFAVAGSGQAQFWTNSQASPVVVQIGDGTTPTSGAGYSVSLKQYAIGVSNQVAALSTATFPSGASDANRLVLSTNATSEGNLTNSVDRNYLTIAGYNAANGTSNVAGTALGAQRVVGFASGTGLNSLTGTTTTAYPLVENDAFKNNSVRSAVATSGPTSDAWMAGTGSPSSTGGIRYAGTNTQVTGSQTNLRSADIYGGQLMVSTGSGTQGIYTIGTGLPTNSGNTYTNLITSAGGGTPSPYEFAAFNDPDGNQSNLPHGLNRMYVADDRSAASGGGIQRYSWNGSAWEFNYSITLTDGTVGARGLAGVTTSEGASPTLFATNATGTKLYQFVDDGTESGAEGSMLILATAPANTVFRGVGLTPVPEPALLAVAGLMVFGLRRRIVG